MLTRCIPLSKIVTVPRSHSVGSGPRENISLRIVEATSVLMPVSLGNVTTMAVEANIATQINTEMLELISEKISVVLQLGSVTGAQLTWQSVFKWIKEGDYQVNKYGTIKQDIAPQRHVTANPKQDRLGPQFLLPFHFVEHGIRALEEIHNFGPLVVPFCRIQDFDFRVGRDVLTDFGYREHDLFQCAVVSNNFDLCGMCGKIH